MTSNPSARMGLRRSPYVFTEQGVAMLSSVLHSDRAIEVNIQIMRAFVRIRQYLATHKELAKKITEHDSKITFLFGRVGEILERLDKPIIKKIAGFRGN